MSAAAEANVCFGRNADVGDGDLQEHEVNCNTWTADDQTFLFRMQRLKPTQSLRVPFREALRLHI